MWNASNKDLMGSITLSPFLARSGQKAGPPNPPRAKKLNYDLTDTCINETVAARSITHYYPKIMPFFAFKLTMIRRHKPKGAL